MSVSPKNSADSTPAQLPLLPETIEIRLTQGFIAIVDACDADLAQFQWHAIRTKSGGAYASRKYRDENDQYITVYLHRVIMERVLGWRPSANVEVDHIDRDSLNCLRSNLRLATSFQNNANQGLRSDNKSGYRGVYLHKPTGKWGARITISKKVRQLGLFDTPEIAYAAYCEEARRHFGDFFNDHTKSLW